MRGSQREGRFKVDFENKSIEEGIVDDLRSPVGTSVDWYVFNPDILTTHATDVIDDIYDVSNQGSGKGLYWNNPLSVPVIMAQITRGATMMNERGRYIVDTLRCVISVPDLNRLLPTFVSNPNDHTRDRIMVQNEVYVPTRVLPRGRYKDYYAVVTVDFNQCNPEELVNFQQFLANAN